MLGLMLGQPEASLKARIFSAFRDIAADPGLDKAYKAAVLTLPAEAYVAERVLEIDPTMIRAARNDLRMGLASALRGELIQIDQEAQAQPKTNYSPDPISSGARSLANLAQHWLGLSGVLSADALLDRFMKADNMTNRMAALSLLVELNLPQTAQALEAYLEKFRHHDLAIDKWFTVQAMLLDDEALSRVQKLLGHSLYDPSNPNRLRALLGAFFNQNLPGFHREDGAGYELWAEQVLATDRKNSQIASRMARALDRWSRFEPKRRALMRDALVKVASDARLSPDVEEVVSKALG
jgi:aminopeptidase N